MIDGQQLLAALAHFSLSGEEIFRGRFISHPWVSRKIAQAVDALSHAAFSAADEAATFVGIGFARMRDDVVRWSSVISSIVTLFVVSPVQQRCVRILRRQSGVRPVGQYSHPRNGGGMKGSMTQNQTGHVQTPSWHAKRNRRGAGNAIRIMVRRGPRCLDTRAGCSSAADHSGTILRCSSDSCF
jgi:hypothetical protein